MQPTTIGHGQSSMFLQPSGRGFTSITSSGRIDLTRSQTNDWVVRSQMFSSHLVVHWRCGEPIIDGYGKTASEAWAMARNTYATPPVEHHDDAELCEKLGAHGDHRFVWCGVNSKRLVTVEHFLTTD